MIKIITDEKYQSTKKRKKSCTKKHKNGKIEYQLEILKLLDQGLYAQQVSQVTSLSVKKISQIINGLKKSDLIFQIQKFPKLYQLTMNGKNLLTLNNNDLKNKKCPLIPPAIHALRYWNYLVQKPSWLSSIKDGERFRGILIKQVKMANWIKYLLYFPYQQFNGLTNIEVCHEKIIYNFNKNYKDQLIYSKEHETRYLQDLTNECINARDFLNRKDFVIDMADPTPYENKEGKIGEYAIRSQGPHHVASLGKHLTFSIKTLSGKEVWVDHSKGPGEEEAYNTDSYFYSAEAINIAKDEMVEMSQQLNKKFDALMVHNQRMEQKLESLDNNFTKMVAIMEKMIGMISPPSQPQDVLDNSGGMFR